MNLPSPGTKCVDCKICDAAVYADGAPICWHCDAGERCPGPRVTPAEPIANTPTESQKGVSTMPHQGSKCPRISEETKAAIRAADPSISNVQLVRQLGVSYPSVSLIRKQAGIASTARPGPHAKPARRKPRAENANKSRALAIAEPPVPAVGEITVTICTAVSEQRAKEIFAALAPYLKAVALQAALTRTLEESCS